MAFFLSIVFAIIATGEVFAISLALTNPASTSLNVSVTDRVDRFDDFTVGHMHNELTTFTAEEIALGFINALKLQGLESSEERQTEYLYSSNEYPEDDMQIEVEAVAGAPRQQLTRANIMYLLHSLPITLLNTEYLHGVEFYELYRAVPLYTGMFDNKMSSNNPSPALVLTNETGSDSNIATSKKRSVNGLSLSSQPVNSSTTVLSAPALANERIEINFYFVGVQIPRARFFAAILQTIFSVGLNNAAAHVHRAHLQGPNSPAWVFVIENTPTQYQLRGDHVLAILESIARHSVHQNTYREVRYDFIMNGEKVSSGCVTVPQTNRMWCRGLPRPDMQSVGGGSVSAHG